jgi:glycosyltransferase involved in cell wall biosynthesis
MAPGAIDLERYIDVPCDGVREAFGLSESHIMVTAVGHAVPVKGWDLLIHSFAKSASRAPSARLLLIGSIDAPDEAETARSLHALAEKLGVADRVQLAGRRDNIPEILAASDVFVMPSRSEGDPFALKEAMASGLPCIGARVGGIPDQIVHHQNGLLFDREDVTAFADLLVELLTDRDLQRRLGENARVSVQRYSLSRASKMKFELYQKLLAQADRVRPGTTTADG